MSWEVLNGEETASDHQYLLIHIRERERRGWESDVYAYEGWNIRSLDPLEFAKSTEEKRECRYWFSDSYYTKEYLCILGPHVYFFSF